MLHHCCVPRCTSNSRDETAKVVSFYSFPKDRAPALKWIAKIRRDVGDHFQVSERTKCVHYISKLTTNALEAEDGQMTRI